MNYDLLLDLAVDLGYELAMCGAETYRVEESIHRMLLSYGIESETFAITNCLTVSIKTADGASITRMRRIGAHGSDLDAVERFSGLSRAICNRRPTPEEGMRWLQITREGRRSYSRCILLLGDFLGASGFALLFGGSWSDGLCAGVCGIIIGLIELLTDRLKATQFFKTIFAAFLMALLAYTMGAFGLTLRPDAVIIGALMILVPGLLFTNAMRDIIHGDTNAGMNRIIQVLLIAVALALGTAAAWNTVMAICGEPVSADPIPYHFLLHCIAGFIGCYGFSLLFNIHGPGGLLCALGGMLTWAIYLITVELAGSDLTGYFWSALFASVYSEIMARIRKYPAISYLVISIFTLIPGAGVYYTMNYAVRGEMALFAEKGLHTAAVAGIIAVGVVLGSTVIRLLSTQRAAEHTK